MIKEFPFFGNSFFFSIFGMDNAHFYQNLRHYETISDCCACNVLNGIIFPR